MTPEDETEEGEEEPGEGSPAAGGCVIALGIGVPLAGVYAASVDAGILATVAIGTAALWRAARSVPSAANPAPPPPPEGAGEAKHQFSIVEGENGHCSVLWTEEA
ncbi:MULTISPECIES: hypothetical protein [unclassified Streptomyces]|uniref:hypothetical protein n=1 Tax=unclassified Streptomyces TaxID=2593676 RepID=UPI000978D98B|nr:MULTISPECIES: hypothetical protein [unclassified Streptomyces]ONI48644.1 hypothetical protein STIB_71980 [Streptomyces sp. IB2014 011-1]RDV48179.1 hypothetical protein DDV98_28840 [Streptomyces sp. IB2014 011-12]